MSKEDKINRNIGFEIGRILRRRSPFLSKLFFRLLAFEYKCFAEYHLSMTKMYLRIAQLIEKNTRLNEK